MKNNYNKLTRCGIIGLLIVLPFMIWSQTLKTKGATFEHPTQVPQGDIKESIKQLSIRPEAKALLQKVIQARDTNQKQVIESLDGIFGQSSFQLPVRPKINSLTTRQYEQLVITRNKQDVPIFIKGKQNQVLTANEPSTSRSTNYARIATNFLTEYQDLLQISKPADEFKEKEVITDTKGNTHIKLQQYWQNIPVWNSQVIVHTNTNGVYAFNGRYHPSLNIAPPPSTISKAAAIATVHQRLGKENYSLPEILKKMLPNGAAAKGELVYYFSASATTAQLVWKIEVSTKNLEHLLFLVDAVDGTIIKKVNQSCSFTGPTTAKAKDLHGVTQTIHTYDNGEKYYLVDGSRQMFDPISTVPGGEKGAIFTADARGYGYGALDSVRYISSTDNVWTDPAAVSAHHHAGICQDYFYKTFGRNSIDGKGSNIVSFVNFDRKDNAAWNSLLQVMIYGYGEEVFQEGSLAKSLDIAAHEMAHGVISSSANLVYSFQSGALNESFADIFGVMVDRDEWTLGEDIANPSFFQSGAMRNMENPANGTTKGQDGWQPSHMSEYLILSETDDLGGIHGNSGIPNRAFYLFATAVGKEKAEQVYYKALTEYLTPEAQFIDCRLAVIAAALELYDTATADAAATAFDEVGIYESEANEPLEDLPAVEGLEYLLTQTTNADGQSVIAEYDFAESSYKLKSPYQFKPRLSVEEQGNLAIFVGADHNIYLIDLDNDDPSTNTTLFWDETEYGIQWHKVAISRDARKIALLTYPKGPTVFVYDVVTDKIHNFDIAPNHIGTQANNPKHLNALEFDPTSQYLIYDAYNESINQKGFWDIGIVHVWNTANDEPATGQIWKPFSNLPTGYSIINPIFSNTSARRIAYEVINQEEEVSQIITRDFNNFNYSIVATNAFYNDFSLIGSPCFAPDDAYLAYVTDKGESYNYVTFQLLDTDKITPVGNNVGSIGGNFPIWYARGTRNFQSPNPAFSASTTSGIAPLVVNFKDESTNSPLIWTWEFEGGTPRRSQERHPTVTFTQPGRHAVRLKVSNDVGERSAIKVGYIEVIGDPDCAYPTGLRTAKVGYSHIQLVWEESPETRAYQTRGRLNGGAWNIRTSPDIPNVTWRGLPPCLDYEFQIRKTCTASDGTLTWGEYSPSIFVETEGCEDTYCYSYGQPWDHWINKVSLNTLQQESGNDSGYENYTNLSTSLEREKEYDLIIEPGYAEEALQDTAYYRVWIDFNQDNDFEDSGELVTESIQASKSILKATIPIPSEAMLGSTRMRVSFSKDRFLNSCDEEVASEVEDYTIIIEDDTTRQLSLNASLSQTSLPPNAGTTSLVLSANTSWQIESDASWLRFSSMSDVINQGLSIRSVAIYYESNEMTAERTAIIRLTGEGVALQTFTLTQAGAEDPILDQQVTYVNQLATGNNNGSSWRDAYTNLQVATASTNAGEIWVAGGFYLPTTTRDRTISFKLNPNVSLFGGFPTTGTPTWEDRNAATYPTILSGDIGVFGTRDDNTLHIVRIDTTTIFDNTVDGFTITGGTAEEAGGGANVGNSYNNPASIFTFRNCLFKENYSADKGGAIHGNRLTLNIENCQFEDNSADDSGGAVAYYSGFGSTQEAQLHILNCTFNANHAGSHGGAVESGSVSRIVGCLFLENHADSDGGAISHTTGLSKTVEDSLFVTNCTFVLNTTDNRGYAISNVGWLSTFTLITNSVFYKNGTDNRWLFNFYGFAASDSYAKIDYSLIDSPTCPSDVVCGEKVIFDQSSPFMDAEGNDFRPKAGSSLINNGKNSYLYPILAQDLNNNPRIIEEVVDIGAYEASFSSTIISIPNHLSSVVSEDAVVGQTVSARIFPNPSSQQSTLQLKEPAPSDIQGRILSRDGQIMQHFLIKKGQIAIDLSLRDYPTGVYWTKLVGADFVAPAVKLLVIK